MTHALESKLGLLAGSQGQLHGAKNSLENFASLSISITLFLLPRKTLSAHDTFNYINNNFKSLTNPLHVYTPLLAFPEGSTQAAIHASSRGGIETDIA